MYKPLYSILILFTLMYACRTAKNNYPEDRLSYSPVSVSLQDTISRLDSILFEAYNNCRLNIFDSLLSENIEFYHDQGGLNTSKESLLKALKNNICGKVARRLLPGSIEVYPIPNFGAIQFGRHQFINASEPSNQVSRFSKFVHTWKREPQGWKLFRVISLH